MDWQKEFNKLKQDVATAITEAKHDLDLNELKNKYLGRKGEVAKVFEELKTVAAEQRPLLGKLANELKVEIEDLLKSAEDKFSHQVKRADYQDLTLPGIRPKVGATHPVSSTISELIKVFSRLGFMVLEGPDLESDYYNFKALNIPDTHPARDSHDTFFIEGHEGVVLKTHTSAMQARVMQKFGAPLRAIFPGRCFRYEATDASHDTTFYQLEGLMIDKDITVANLIYVMQELLREVLKKDVKVRLRPGFFPFVEPGFELDVNCWNCEGVGCSVCKQTGWVEMLPCGLVHPNVLRAGGIDPDVYSGFAFGLGLTRLTMMKYGIDDIRILQSGDLRFISQF